MVDYVVIAPPDVSVSFPYSDWDCLHYTYLGQKATYIAVSGSQMEWIDSPPHIMMLPSPPQPLSPYPFTYTSGPKGVKLSNFLCSRKQYAGCHGIRTHDPWIMNRELDFWPWHIFMKVMPSNLTSSLSKRCIEQWYTIFLLHVTLSFSFTHVRIRLALSVVH